MKIFWIVQGTRCNGFHWFEESYANTQILFCLIFIRLFPSTDPVRHQPSFIYMYVLHCEIRYPVYSDTKCPVHVFLDRFISNLNYKICMVDTSSSSFPFWHLLPPPVHLRLLIHTKTNACSKRNLTSVGHNIYSAISYLHSRCSFNAFSKAVMFGSECRRVEMGMVRGLQTYL